MKFRPRDLAVATLLLGQLPAMSSALATTLPGPVVSAQWLQEHQKDVVILDVRDDLETWTAAPEFETDKTTGKSKLTQTGGHIAGALPLDFSKVRVARMEEGRKIDKMLPDKAAVRDLMQATGLTKDRPIVITMPGESVEEVDEAARVYWTLRYYGAGELAILDGGNAAWLQGGFPVSQEGIKVARGNWEPAFERRELLVGMADVEQAIRDKTQLVDARPASQYLGVVAKKPAVLAAGHVEGARNLPGDLRVRPSGLAMQFLKPEEYVAVYRAMNVDPQAPTVTYCNTGHMAAGSWFIQSEILHAPVVQLYDGSMHEWTTFGRPVVGLGS